MMQKNPVAMEGRLERCWLFAYRMPSAFADSLLPPGFSAVEFGGFGFMGIVVCEISGMRPAGMPRAAGLRYRHVGYRLHARFGGAGGDGISCPV